MDTETLRRVAEMALETARELSRGAGECNFAPQREARYEISFAFTEFASRLNHAAENSGP